MEPFATEARVSEHPATLLHTPDAGALLRATLEVALRHVDAPLVLAVSGGRDSMALLHAMARWAPERVAAVATFDHGTGEHATEAASLVAAQARRLGLTVVRERARFADAAPASVDARAMSDREERRQPQSAARSEAAWRTARWGFLRRVARGFRARVATAHTRDDQLETIVMRLMRGCGTRGLASLAAPSPIVRPFLGLSRAELARWVHEESIAWIEDPTNASPRYLRARVRHQLLPALQAASPGVGTDLLGLAERAAGWRRELDAWLVDMGLEVTADGARATLPTAVLEHTTRAGQAVVWAALCAHAGVVLDARGTRAVLRFTSTRRRGAAIPLAGGATVLRRGDGISAGASGGASARDVFEVRRAVPTRPPLAWSGAVEELPARVGGWRFKRLGTTPDVHDGWTAALPMGAPVVVRAWAPGDRIRTAGAPAGRRVARYLSEARVPALDRPLWPVVVVDNEVSWVPGVCRSGAAPSRSGRPELIWFRCERERE